MGFAKHTNQLQTSETYDKALTLRLIGVLKSVNALAEWEKADTPSQTFLYQLKAAQNVGIFQPFTAEQHALNAYLTKHRAGQRLCEYAWRTYAQSI